MIANITQVTIDTNSIPVISVSAGVQGPPGPTGSTGTVDFLAVASNIIPDTDNTRTLGTPSKRWNHVYVGPGSITIGDAVLSLDGGKITSSTGFKLTNSTVADALPAQTGNSGKYLTTNGTALSWATVTSGTTDYNNLTNKPSIPTSFSSLVNGAKTVSLGTNGTLTLPAPLAQLTDASQLATDTAKIYRATNSTDTTAITNAWATWYEHEQLFRFYVTEEESGRGSNFPWHGMPSWEAYPLIMNWNSQGGPGLPLNPSMAPAAKTAQDSYLAYKQLVSSIDIVNGNKTISFNNAGLLSLPGKLEFKDTANAKIILKTIDPYGYVVEDSEQDKTWTFGANGNTTFPTGLVLGAPRGSGTVNFTSAIDKEFQIETGTASYSKLWRFETNGNTTLPTGLTFRKNGTPYSTITADLDKVLQIETQTSGGVKQWSLGTDGWLTLPNNGVVQSNTLISLSSFNDTNNIARVTCQSFSNTPQINLRTITSTGAQQDWVFASTGALTFPDGTTTTGKGITVPVDQSLTVNTSYSMGPGGATTFKINPESIKLPSGNGVIFSGTEIAANSWGLDSANKTLYFPDAGDGVFPQIRYSTTGNDGMQLFTAAKPIKITTASNTHWTFGTNGNTTFPTGLVLGAPRGVNTVNFTSAIDKEFQIETQTSSTGKLWRFGTDGILTLPSNNYLETTDTNLKVGAQGTVTIRSNAATVEGTNAWVFGATGRTTFPNGVVPEHSYGAAGDKEGMVVFSDPYIYYCKQDYVNNSTDIWVRVAWTGTNW